MVLDRQKVQTDGRRQNYIPPTSSGDNKGYLRTLADERVDEKSCYWREKVEFIPCAMAFSKHPAPGQDN